MSDLSTVTPRGDRTKLTDAHRPHAARAAAPVRAAHGRRDLREARNAEPGRVGQGSRGARHDARGRTVGRARRRTHSARRDVRQHRHRLRDARRRARTPRAALRARQRDARAQAAAADLRRGPRAHRSDGRQRRRDPPGPRASTSAMPQRYFYPDQYSNPANWRAHFDTTGVEILEQTDGRLTHFVAGLGTSGTFVGTGRRLRQERPEVQLVSVQPDSPLHGLEGLKHMASAIVPAIYDPTLADLDVGVSTDDAHRLARRLAREEGLFVGPSSGAALAAAMDAGVQPSVGRDRRDLSRRRRSLPVGSAVGGRRRRTGELDRRGRPAAAAHPGRGAGAAMRRHAARIYPNECCGAMLGPSAGHVTEAFALDNTFPDTQRRRFLVGPDEYRRAEARATETGLVAARLLSFASGSSGRAVAVRPGPRVAEPELPHHLGSAGTAEGSAVVAARSGPIRVRRGVRRTLG